nr:MAG TPA: hypothetical protein [Caudoviricetes sp.]
MPRPQPTHKMLFICKAAGRTCPAPTKANIE